MEEQKPKIQKKRKKRRISKRSKLLIILCYELIVGVIMLNIFLNSISLNSSEEIQYADQSGIDDIRYEENTLIVNNVNVTVPPDENVSYNISYSWGKNDKKYPTVPRSITASYKSKNDTELYDITLYKESLTPKEEIPPEKNEANWFGDWRTGRDGNSMRELKDTKNVHGILIDTKENDEDTHIYENIRYYFTVPSDGGIAVYVLEGNLYNRKANEIMQKTMNSAIDSIKVKKKMPEAQEA